MPAETCTIAEHHGPAFLILLSSLICFQSLSHARGVYGRYQNAGTSPLSLPPSPFPLLSFSLIDGVFPPRKSRRGWFSMARLRARKRRRLYYDPKIERKVLFSPRFRSPELPSCLPGCCGCIYAWATTKTRRLYSLSGATCASRRGLRRGRRRARA